jgi:hypothetical protein
LSVRAGQLLIWDTLDNGSGTAIIAQNWRGTKRPQYILPYPGTRDAHIAKPKNGSYKTLITLARSDTSEVLNFDNIAQAAKAALAFASSENTRAQQGLSLELLSPKTTDKNSEHVTAMKLAEATVPGGVLVNEAFAHLLAISHFDIYSTRYLGQISTHERVFSLSAIHPA